MKIIMLSILLPLTMLTIQCSTSKDIQQGLKGRVVWIEGNQMPGPGKDPVDPKPVERTLYVMPLLNTSEVKMDGTFITDLPEEPIKKVKSNKEGMFKAALEPGRYTILVKENDHFFANMFDGEGNITPVTVKESQVSSLVIEINYQAAY